jgi:hypothetical protein
MNIILSKHEAIYVARHNDNIQKYTVRTIYNIKCYYRLFKSNRTYITSFLSNCNKWIIFVRIWYLNIWRSFMSLLLTTHCMLQAYCVFLIYIYIYTCKFILVFRKATENVIYFLKKEMK